jgi:fibronectin-binding autotransporter adhesin
VYTLSGGNLRVTGWSCFVGCNTGATGTLNISGGTMTCAGGGIELGKGGTGYLYLSGSGYIDSPTNRMVVGGATDATGYAEQTGGTASVRGIRIGTASGATGAYDLKGGLISIVDRDLPVAYGTGSTGIMNISGGSIVWGYIPNQKTPSGLADTFLVGYNGAGTVTHTAGNVDTTGSIYGYTWLGGLEVTVSGGSLSNTWASGTTGNGTYNLKDAGSLTTLGLIVGGLGAGTFNQSGGTLNATSSLAASVWDSGSYGYGIVPTSLASLPYNLVIGFGGTSTTTATGVYNLSGGVLDLAAGAGILIGYTGSGTLSISGGVANLNRGTIAGNGTAAFDFSGGTLKNVGSVSTPITLVSGGTGAVFQQDAGYHGTVTGDIGGAGGLTKTGWGKLILTGNNYYSGLTVVRDGKLELAASAQSVVLTADGVGADVQGGRMIFDYSGTAPNVQTPLAYSYNGGQWDRGQFLCTTKDPSHGLGWLNDGSATVTVMYTLYGDSNLDTVVDGTDLNAVLSNYNGSGKIWNQGDFNYDGTVDGSDLNTVLSNYNQHLGVGAAVPEPSTLLLTAAGLLGLLAYAWRKR